MQKIDQKSQKHTEERVEIDLKREKIVKNETKI